MGLIKNVSIVTVAVISMIAFAQWEDSHCTEAFLNAQASTTCTFNVKNHTR